MAEKHDKRRIAENFFSLSLIEGARYLLPFLTVPFLLRVLGPEKYGLVLFAQGIIQYFGVLVEYGFGISATHEISVNRESPERISGIYFSVIIAKILLMIFGFVILVFLIFSIKKLRAEWLLYILTFSTIFGNVFTSIWFFQGLEKMKYITIISIVNRVLFALSIFAFIRKPSHYIYVPVVNSIASFVAGILALYLAFKIFPLKFRFHFPTLIYMFKKSFFFFLSRLSISFYTVTNSVLIGSIFSMEYVAYYGVAEKTVRFFRRPVDLLNRAVYPYASYKRSSEFIKKILKYTFISGVIFMLFIDAFGKPIIMLIGGAQFVPAVKLLRILSLIVPIVSIHVLLGTSVLVAFGKEKYFNLSVIFGSLFYVVTIVSFIALNVLTVPMIAFVRVLADGFILVYRFYCVRKFNLLGGTYA